MRHFRVASFFPQSQKLARVTARLKKPLMDPDDLNFFRPIWNLTFLSKIAVLGPMLFLLYTADLLLLIEGHGLCPHLYTDDTQDDTLPSVCNAGTSEHLYLHRWCGTVDALQPAPKTEVLWSTSSRRLHLLFVSPIRVGTDHVMPVSVVRNLGIYMDADVSVRSHVSTDDYLFSGNIWRCNVYCTTTFIFGKLLRICSLLSNQLRNEKI